MQIPVHQPVPPQELAGLIESALAETVFRRCSVFDLRKSETSGGERLTLVPFMMLCLEGGFGVAGGDGDGHTRWLRPGEAALFAPCSYASVDFHGSVRFFRVTVESDGLLVGMEEVRTSDPENPDPSTGHLKAAWIEGSPDGMAAHLLARLLDPAVTGPRHRLALLEGYLWELADLLGGRERPDSMDDPARVALRFLRDQFHRPINRDLAARALGVSAGHLGRVIRKATGRSFRQVLLELRLEHARALLRQSSLSMEDVALQSGFTSGNYFAQAFRRVEGTSPLKWRERRHYLVGGDNRKLLSWEKAVPIQF